MHSKQKTGNDRLPYIITIGRQLGSGGKQIGELLSERLDIPCYDKELIQIASRESGLCKDVFEKADEKHSYSFLGGIFSFRTGFFGDQTHHYLGNETLFKIQSDIIRQLAEKEPCIFVGRCADYILRDHPRIIRIFVSANLTDRIRRVMQHNDNLSEKEAKNLIEQSDRKRACYYNYYSNKTWGAAMSYDLCFNSSIFDIEEITGFVCDFVAG